MSLDDTRPCRRHDWTPVGEHPTSPESYACSRCPATTGACGTCAKPIGNSSDRTCGRCVTWARTLAWDVRDLYAQLPDVIAGIAGLHAVRYDRGGAGGGKARATDTTLLGGAAMVMASDGNVNHVNPVGAESVDVALREAEHRDPPSVLAVLTSWEDAWRLELGITAAEGRAVALSAAFLVANTAWAAQSSETWDEYLSDLRGLRSRLRMLTGASQPPVIAGVPCPYCSGTIVQRWTGKRGSLSDVRECDECGLTWASEAHFMLAVREAHQSLPKTRPNQLVTLEDAKRIYRPQGVRPNLLALWVNRGHLRPAVGPDGREKRDVRGEPLYRLGDISERLAPAEGSAS